MKQAFKLSMLAGWNETKPAEMLPDPAVCRTWRSQRDGSVYCQVLNPYNCKYVVRVDYDLFCKHPAAGKIVARNETGSHR